MILVHSFSMFVFTGLISMFQAIPSHAIEPGSIAPDFTLEDHTGNKRSLSDPEFKDKYVVLEWFNKDCPYVEKHYQSGNMPKLQEKYSKKGVVWLTIISSAPGKQGYLNQKEAAGIKQKMLPAANYLLSDPTGVTGKAYGATATPTMVVLGMPEIIANKPTRKVAYFGAIDDKPTWKQEDIKTAKNYVALALDSLMSNKKIATAVSKPYGCGVKYSD